MFDKLKKKGDGAMDKAKGEAKERAGDATKEKREEAEGRLDKGKGEFKEGVADGKSRVENASDKVAGN